MLKATVVFTAIMAVIVMCQLTAVVVSADSSDISWDGWQSATEVESIENVDFLYTDPGICWGITWNGPQDWTVEVITGDYFIERLVNGVDIAPAVGCSKD